jgi:hypothetical protein
MLYKTVKVDCLKCLSPSINFRCLKDRNCLLLIFGLSEPGYWIKISREWNLSKNILKIQGTVAHTCNPSYSGGRDQGDWGLKPIPGSLWDPISKKPITKKSDGSRWRPWVQTTQYYKNKINKIFWKCSSDLGMVFHAYNRSCFGGWGRKNASLRPVWLI